MQLPFFYISQYQQDQSILTLDENNSRHVVQVLRMPEGAQLHLTDGKGRLLTATITEPHKKNCVVRVEYQRQEPQRIPRITIALSPLKNNSRFEWFLEKATEIGVATIVPLVSERTEKVHIKTSRLQQILVSALLQSRQTWLPQLTAPVAFSEWINAPEQPSLQKYIAHCLEEERLSLRDQAAEGDAVILIGPEGDFTPAEIHQALEKNYKAVTLGATRLRSETAAMVAATLLCIL